VSGFKKKAVIRSTGSLVIGLGERRKRGNGGMRKSGVTIGPVYDMEEIAGTLMCGARKHQPNAGSGN